MELRKPVCRYCGAPSKAVEPTEGEHTFLCGACMKSQSFKFADPIKVKKPKKVKEVKVDSKREARRLGTNIIDMDENLAGGINDE